MDWLPVVSQLKSLVQFICRDAEGAKRTQENFSRQCPVVSQARSFGEWCAGDSEAARQTQIEQAKFLSGLADSIPVVGHAKGGIHYLCGDTEGGDNAMKAASRTTGQVIGGAVGILGGPVGIAAGAAAGGYVMDGITTGVDSAVHGEYRPSGYVAAVTNIVKDPKDAGKWFDAAAPVIIDAATVAVAFKAQPKWKMEQNMGKAATEATLETAKKAEELMGNLGGRDAKVMACAFEESTGRKAFGVNDQRKTIPGNGKWKTKSGALEKRIPEGFEKGPQSHMDNIANSVNGPPRQTCAEFHARAKADAAGINPDGIAVVQVKPDGKVYPIKPCEPVPGLRADSCQPTVNGLNVVTDKLKPDQPVPNPIRQKTAIGAAIGLQAAEDAFRPDKEDKKKSTNNGSGDNSDNSGDDNNDSGEMELKKKE